MINLIIKNLRGFIKNKVVFCLFILGMAASLTIALYIYSVFASMNAQGYDAQGTYQVATIHLTGQTKESVQRSLSDLSQKRDDMDMVFTMFTEQEQLILASYTRTPFQYGGRYFSRQDFESGAPLVIAAASLYDEYHEAQHLPIGGKDYRILAFSDRPFSEVPFHSLNNDKAIDSVQILFKHMLNQSEIRAMESQLAEAFPGAHVSPPSEPDIRAVSKNLYTSFSSLFIILLALLNVSFLYRYLLTKRKKAYGVYRLCGCSKRQGLWMFYVEVFIITCVLFLLTSLLYHFLLEPWLPTLHITISYTLFFIDYAAVFLLYLVFVTLIYTPILLRFNAQRPVDLIS